MNIQQIVTMIKVADPIQVAAVMQRMKYDGLLIGKEYEIALTIDPKFMRKITRNDLNGVHSFVHRLRKNTRGHIVQIVLKFVTL